MHGNSQSKQNKISPNLLTITKVPWTPTRRISSINNLPEDVPAGARRPRQPSGRPQQVDFYSSHRLGFDGENGSE